jgi:hypothetical protein
MLREKFHYLRVAFKNSFKSSEEQVMALMESREMARGKKNARDLLLNTARELKKEGRLVTVEEFNRKQLNPYYQLDALILRWDRQRDTDHMPMPIKWYSKRVQILTSDSGDNRVSQYIEYFHNNDWVMLGLGDQERKDPDFKDKLSKMSLGTKLRFAMTCAESGPEDANGVGDDGNHGQGVR